MNVSILWTWAWVILAFIATRYTWRGWRKYRERKAQHHQEAIDSLVKAFVQTGQFYSEVASLDRNTVKTALKERSALIRFRVRENREFHAVSACPSCTVVDLHNFDSVLCKTVKRQCKACGYTWRQK